MLNKIRSFGQWLFRVGQWLEKIGAWVKNIGEVITAVPVMA